jgi:hypothetical protein
VSPRRRRLLAVGLAVLVPCVAVAELAGSAAIALRVPSGAEWDSVCTAVRSAHDPADLVVVAPRWAEPHARMRLGDDVMSLAHLARADVSRFARATEISLHGERAPDLSSFTERGTTRVGPFVLRRLENPSHEPVIYDFVERFGPKTRVAWVDRDGVDPAEPCAWADDLPILAGGLAGHPTFPPGRFACPGGPYLTSAVTVIADEKFLPRRCIWAHPFAYGDRVVTFDDVPVGEARRLVGHHGMYWVIERDGLGADVEIEVRVDGQRIGSATHADGDGWSSFVFDLPERPRDARGTVDLAIRSRDDDRRHYCLEATLR